MSKFMRFISLALVALMVMGLAIGVGAQDGEKVLTYSFLSGDVPSIDPSIGTDTSSIQIVTSIFPGLTRLNEVTLELEPGVATWEISEDGLTYTFNIIPEIPWVHFNQDTGEVEQVMDDEGNVRYVTAADFVYGWQRTLAPETGGEYAYVLSPWVVNGDSVNAGDVPVEELGVAAVDTYTLEVQATEATAFLPNIFGLWMAAAQPQWLIEEEEEFWTEAEVIQTYGPFTMSEWDHGNRITLVRNPFWTGTESMPVPALDAVQFSMLEVDVQLANFEAGILDISDVPLAEIDRIRADEELNAALSVGPDSCTYYYGFNTLKAPFDNANIRRAFSQSINRQDLIDNILKGGQLPAFFFSRPDLVAAPVQEDYPDLALSYDPAAAQESLAAGLAELGLASADELPPITLMHNTSLSHAQLAEAVQSMWSETLGVNIEIASMDWAVYLEQVREDAPQIYRLGWCLDYPDANNFLYDVFHSSSEFNGTNWTSEEYDALVEEARTLTDTDERAALYAQAEFLLTNEGAAVAPIYYYTTLELTNPRVERTYSQIGSERFEKWDINAE